MSAFRIGGSKAEFGSRRMVRPGRQLVRTELGESSSLPHGRQTLGPVGLELGDDNRPFQRVPALLPGRHGIGRHRMTSLGGGNVPRRCVRRIECTGRSEPAPAPYTRRDARLGTGNRYAI